jgi:asparagine synthase (glutamine-hydrolysing)
MSSPSEVVPYLIHRANYISPGLSSADIFSPPWASAVDGAAMASLESSVRDVTLGPADMCSYLYLAEHHRRFTIASLELFRHAVEIRMPFVDDDFLRVLFSARPEWRSDTASHRALTASGNAAMLRIRNSNTGAPADASPMVEYALDKLNTVLKRLNVYGFRHYHNFQAWMREQLLTSVETVLLGRQSLDRGVLREDTLRRLLQETREQRADHSYLLQVLLVLELWQQENL